MFSQIGPSRQYNQNFLTFNSLNSYILRGDAAQGMELTFATLMASAADEPDAMYGFAASAVRISPDGLVYRFALRPRGALSRRHQAHRPGCRVLASSCSRTRATRSSSSACARWRASRRRTTRPWSCASSKSARRDVPLFVASLPIFSRAYYTAHNFEETTLDMPLGSGPYKVGRFEPGRYIEYQRVR